MSIMVLGQHVQGLIAGALAARAGQVVDIINFPDGDYKEFYDGCKTGPVSHLPVAISTKIIADLDLKSYGFEIPKEEVSNPFAKLPYYEGLKLLVQMFREMEGTRPPYKEKAWRDTWSTFEIGRFLSEQDEETQNLFARSATLSLTEILDASDLSGNEKAEIIAYAVIGAKTDPASKGSAAAILPAMATYEKNDHVLIHGSLHSLTRALKQAAMAYGANVFNDETIRSVMAEGQHIQSVITSEAQELQADYYIFDFDPVIFFQDYLQNYSISPMYRKRITPDQNTKECLHLKMAVSELPQALNDNQYFIAGDENYIVQAKEDMREDGGSQYPMLSIVNVSGKNPSLANDKAEVIDIMAQYFEPGLDDLEEGPVMAVTQALIKAFPELQDKILHTAITTPPSQFGQASFIGTMPLLQLFRVFAGYHSMGYDMPIQNLLVAGYGSGTAGHYHVNDGGERVASLLQSL